MTAVNVVIQGRQAHLFTDSAACDGLGRVRRLVSKVRLLPGTRCAMGMRGALSGLDILARVLPTLGDDIDQLRVAAVDGRLRAALSPWRCLAHGWFGLLLPFDVTVVGWSADGPRAFMFWNHRRMRSDDGSAVPPPFSPHDIGWANVLPPVPLPEGALHDPLALMPEIVRRQREHREPSVLFPKGRRFVGGFIEETIISARGLETRQVGGWNEPLGQPIGGGTEHHGAMRRLAIMWVGMLLTPAAALVVGGIAWGLLSGRGVTW